MKNMKAMKKEKQNAVLYALCPLLHASPPEPSLPPPLAWLSRSSLRSFLGLGGKGVYNFRSNQVRSSEGDRTMKKAPGRARKVLGIVFLVVLLAGIAVRIALPPVAVLIVNRRLPDYLDAPASLGGITLSLSRGTVGIIDLRIAQPEGFGDGDLLRVGRASVQVSLSSLFRPPLTIKSVQIEDAAANLVKDSAGVMNVSALVKPGEEEEPAAAGEEEQAAGEPSPILLKRLAASGLSFSYLDRSGGAAAAAEAGAGDAAAFSGQTQEGEPREWGVKIAGLDLEVTGLRLDPGADPARVGPAEATLTARLDQAPLPEGYLGVAAKIGPLGGGIPALNAAVRLAGLELEPLAPVVPAGTAAALGGDALDLFADVALAPDVLDCLVRVEAAGGHTLSLEVGGTPEHPEVDTSGVLFSIMLHAGGGVGTLVGNIGGAGLATVGAVGEGALAVGTGAVNAVGSLGSGLFQTVAGAATGDLDAVGEGLSTATVGTVSEAANGVAGAGEKLADGAVSAAESTVGADADREWRADTHRRWLAGWQAALALVATEPYPPVPGEQEEGTAAEPDAAPGPSPSGPGE